MQSIDLRRSTARFGVDVAVAVRNGFVTLGRTLRQWNRILNTRSDLAEMDDRMLADLGISRAQADFQLNNAPWRLANRTNSRR